MSERAAWAKSFVAAQASFPKIDKGKTAKIPTKSGSSYSYKYADLADVITAIQPVLAKNGLAQAQAVETHDGLVSVTTRIYHSEGHVEEFGPVNLRAGGTAQEAGSAITYARRYSLCAALGIVPDEDDDGKIASQFEAGSAPAEPTAAAPGRSSLSAAAPSKSPKKGVGAAPSSEDFERHLALIEKAVDAQVTVRGKKLTPALVRARADVLATNNGLSPIPESVAVAKTTHLVTALAEREPRLSALLVNDLELAGASS